jgi:Na+-transporting methylmalonyl-CoA/oxaloacetate decarboxylase gamma subunit
MLAQGFILMFVGMGIVIAYLAIMVFVMSWSQSLIKHIDHILPDDVPVAPRPQPVRTDDAAPVAIAIAVASNRP